MKASTALAIPLAHLIGDYIIQTEWMAMEKTSRWAPALTHGLTYTIPYLTVTRSPKALLVIAGTHAVIDRYRLAKHLIWVKNQIGPSRYRTPWSKSKKTGYSDEKPDWMSTWLMIITDNTMHLAINTAAIKWL